jgi:hypothetical protein
MNSACKLLIFKLIINFVMSKMDFMASPNGIILDPS